MNLRGRLSPLESGAHEARSESLSQCRSSFRFGDQSNGSCSRTVDVCNRPEKNRLDTPRQLPNKTCANRFCHLPVVHFVTDGARGENGIGKPGELCSPKL